MTAHVLSRRKRHPAANLLMALPFSVLAAIAVAVGWVIYVLWPTWSTTAAVLDAPALPIIVGGALFEIPPAAIRTSVQRHAGPAERLDLVFMWPTLKPPNSDGKSAETAAGGAAAATAGDQRLFVTIAPLGTLPPPAERLRAIYTRYVEGTADAGPNGLAILSFRAGTPYYGEDLVYVAGDPERFFARCTRQVGAVPGSCLHERLIDGAELTLRFPRSWIGDWRGLTGAFDQLVNQLHPQQSQIGSPAESR